MPISYKPLWKLLIDKEMKKNELCSVADISRGTLTRMGKSEHVSTEVLVKICNALDCKISDIIEVLPEEKAPEK